MLAEKKRASIQEKKPAHVSASHHIGQHQQSSGTQRGSHAPAWARAGWLSSL